MKNEIIQNSGKIIFNIGDLLESDDFLESLKDYLNITNNIDKNKIYFIFNKIKNKSQLEKEELIYIYYFLNDIGKINFKQNHKYDSLLKLKEYIFNELFNNQNGLITEIKDFIFNLLNIKSFEIKNDTQSFETYGDIGVIFQTNPQIGYIIGSKGISKINKQNGKLEKTTGDLGIGNIYFSLNEVENLNDTKEVYIYGNNGIVIINTYTLEIIKKTDNLGIGKISKNNFLKEGNKYIYLMGTKGIIQLNKENFDILTKITYEDILKKDEKEKKIDITIFELESLIDEIERENHIFKNIIENLSLTDFLKNIDFNLDEIKKEFNNLEPLNIIDIISLLTGIPLQHIENLTREDKIEIEHFRNQIGFNKNELNDEEFLLFCSYILKTIHEENTIIGKKYKDFLVNHIISFAKKELPNIDKDIFNNINILSSYIKYYIDKHLTTDFIDKKGKNDQLLYMSSKYKKGVNVK